MSTVNIKLLSPVVITKPNASKAYKQMVVTHTDGKDTTGKKIFDFTTPKHVWDTLAAAKQDDTFLITREKNDKGYWEWKDIGAATSTLVVTTPDAPKSNVGAVAAAPAKVGNWETSDERAKKQVYIVRQSNLNIATEIVKHNSTFEGTGVDLRDVFKVAKQLEDYVFANGVAGLTDDQPE